MCGMNVILLGPFGVQDYNFKRTIKNINFVCEKIISGSQTHNFRREANESGTPWSLE